MHILHRIRNNPIVVLCVMAAALIVWIAMDLLPSRAPTYNPETATIPPPTIPPPPPKPGKFLRPPEPPLPHSMPVTVGMLPKLKLGMTRIEVERLLGPPAPDQLQPVIQTNGCPTYCTAYELIDSEIPMTIRPIQPKAARIPDRSVETKTHVTLEYDASKPGHPLIEVHYPDPLF
jgi:hypothetical protein